MTMRWYSHVWILIDKKGVFELFIGIKQVANLFGVSLSTMRRWIRTDKCTIKFIRHGQKGKLLTKMEWIEAGIEKLSSDGVNQ